MIKPYAVQAILKVQNVEFPNIAAETAILIACAYVTMRNLVGGSVRRERRPMKSEHGLQDVKARTGANRCLRQAIRAVRFGLLRSRTIDARISSTVEQRVRLFVRLIKLGLYCLIKSVHKVISQCANPCSG